MNKLIIGTVQFGLDYGITNQTGKVSQEDLDKIFNFCYKNNIFYFDTAQDYGTSENIVAEYNKLYPNFKIITKSKFKDKNIDETINKSIEKFEKIECFMLHSFEDYNNKEIINKLFKYKKNGIQRIFDAQDTQRVATKFDSVKFLAISERLHLSDVANQGWSTAGLSSAQVLLKPGEKINKIGVSIYNVEEGIILLKENNIDVIQLPFNYLDNQWFNPEFQDLLKKNNIEIHVRSIFLQGILLNPMNINKIPKNILQKDFNELNDIINELCNNLNLSKLELCFAYINSFEWINKFLIGIDNYEHLLLNYNIINKNLKLNIEDISMIHNKVKNINNLISCPNKWIF